MAVFPDPNTTQTVEMGDVTYKWNGDAWQVDVGSGGGGSAGNWTDSPEEATLDGVIALEPQAGGDIPSGTSAGYAKIYAKDVGSSTGNICLHADNNLTDSGSAGATVTKPGTYNSLSFDSSNKRFGTHSFKFDPESGSDAFLIVPYSADIKFDADFTFECFVKFNSDTEDQLFNTIIEPDRSGETGSNGSSYPDGIRLAYYGVDGGGGSSEGKFYWSMSNEALNDREYGLYEHGLTTSELIGPWLHIAVCRDSSGGRFYLNGNRLTLSTDGGVEGTDATINTSEENYVMGRRHEAPTTYNTQSLSSTIKFAGNIDEVRFTKGEAKYTGATYTVPINPFGFAETNIYVRNSAGVETKLS